MTTKSDIKEIKAIKNLKPEQIEAAQVLAFNGYRPGQRSRHGCITLAAEEVGVHRQTVHDWLKKEEFLDAIFMFSEKAYQKLLVRLQEFIDAGSLTALVERMNRLMPEANSKLHYLKVKHEQDKELLELRHQLGIEEPEAREAPKIEFVVVKSGEKIPEVPEIEEAKAIDE
jgi:hypothetical protein